MNWEDILKYLEDNKDSEDVKKYIKGVQRTLTLDEAKAFLDTDPEAIKFLQGERDRAVSKGISTYETKTLPDKIAEATKGLKAEPSAAEKRIQVLEEDSRKRDLREAELTLENEAIKALTEHGLPVSLAKQMVGSDTEATATNIKLFKAEYEAAVTKQVDERLKSTSHVPNTDDNKDHSKGANPWKRETFNLTKQGEIVKSDKVLAVKMAAEAGITLS